MKSIMPQLDPKSAVPIYIQLFDYIKDSILSGEIVHGEKLTSLRNLSESLGISITTTALAYEQLEVEGYIVSKPRSGYFVREVPAAVSKPTASEDPSPSDLPAHKEKLLYDLSSFDFVKWKKCFSKVLNEYPEELLFESDPRGEAALRNEIAKYVYYSRGVRCTPEQIVIAAGMQQITALLASLLKRMGIEHVAVEDPGYDPVISSFRDRSFAITKVPVERDGIKIEKLPANIQAAAYVNPSNQFPTGAVMPIARRYQLLEWAAANNSYIIEDDYDSELRYIGRPIPAMQGLDTQDRVIYLGSFSSTLFAAIKISYMVMPGALADTYRDISSTYTQTCSKAEQLTLALFMQKGYYQTGIKRIRRLYSQKLSAVIEAFDGDEDIQTLNTFSGINVLLRSEDENVISRILTRSAGLGIRMQQLDEKELIFYYNQIPLEEIPKLIEELRKK